MSNAKVVVPKYSDGVNIDNSELTIDGINVKRQRVEVYSGETLPVSGTFWQTTQPVSMSNQSLGVGGMTTDAWGVQKMSLPKSVFHGMWTYDVNPNQFFMYENGTQVYTSTNIVSTSGAVVLTTSATKTGLILEGRECPRYQPNRGHLFSTALWCPLKTKNGVRDWGVRTAENGVYFRLKADGLLYAVLKSGGSETKEQLIDTSGVAGFDVQKGNVYDIQYQWRGVGNYKFFINLQLVHTFANLGTLTALSMQNPALPVHFSCTRTTEDVAMHVGCVDLTSENGSDDTQEYGFAYAAAVATSGTDKPVLCLYKPLQISGVTNTRTLNMSSVTVTCNKKSTLKIWRTRSAGDITGATFKEIGGGTYVQTDSPDMTSGAVRATAVTTANLKLQSVIILEAGVTRIVDMPNQNVIQFNMVRGDYLIFTCDGTTATTDIVVKWGDEV